MFYERRTVARHNAPIKPPPRHPTIDELDLVTVLSAFGHPIRMQIVLALAHGGEHGWGQLDVPVANSTLSHHLKLLRDSGITHTRAEGSRCFVSLRREDLDRRFPGLVDAILDAQSDPSTSQDHLLEEGAGR